MILLILKNKGGCIEIIDKQKYEQNRKNKYLKMQVTIIKQITERNLLGINNVYLIIQTDYYKILILTALYISISAIVLAITSIFRGGVGGSVFLTKDKEAFKKSLNRLVDTLKRLAGKVPEAFSAVVGSVVRAVILRFLSKAIGFAYENVWALITFVAGFMAV